MVSDPIPDTQLDEWERLAADSKKLPYPDAPMLPAHGLLFFAARTAVPALCAEVRRLRAAHWKCMDLAANGFEGACEQYGVDSINAKRIWDLYQSIAATEVEARP